MITDEQRRLYELGVRRTLTQMGVRLGKGEFTRLVDIAGISNIIGAAKLKSRAEDEYSDPHEAYRKLKYGCLGFWRAPTPSILRKQRMGALFLLERDLNPQNSNGSCLVYSTKTKP